MNWKTEANARITEHYNEIPRIGDFKQNWKQAKKHAIIELESIIHSLNILIQGSNSQPIVKGWISEKRNHYKKILKELREI